MPYSDVLREYRSNRRLYILPIHMHLIVHYIAACEFVLGMPTGSSCQREKWFGAR